MCPAICKNIWLLLRYHEQSGIGNGKDCSLPLARRERQFAIAGNGVGGEADGRKHFDGRRPCAAYVGGIPESIIQSGWPEGFRRIIHITERFSAGWRKVHTPEAGHDAASSGGSTKFAVETDLGITWTTTAVGDALKEEAGQEFEKKVDTEKILDCLLADCPYELYWFDKTAGVS